MSKSKLVEQLNEQLKEIFNDRSLTPQQRGEMGEDVVFSLTDYWVSRYEDYYIERSYMYEQGTVFPTRSSQEEKPVTETDILVVTPYAVFVVEVKTVYGEIVIHPNFEMEIFRKGKSNGFENKNYLRQNEMHARHIYYHIHHLLPEGSPKYIKPLIVMTGKTKITDKRDKRDKLKMPITITNNLIPVFETLNKPNKFLLDVNAIKKKLEKVQVLDTSRLLNSQKFK